MKEHKNLNYLNIADQRRARVTKKGGIPELILLWVLPFIAINLVIFYIATAQPNFSINISNNNNYLSSDVTVNIKSSFPIDTFYAALGNEPLEMANTDKKTYTATVTSNGTLEVTVVNKNGMSKTVYENISSIDDAPPMVSGDDSAPGFISLHVEDTQSGVNFDSVYALDSDNKRITPSLIDEGDGLVVFNYDTPTLEVHVSDNVGHESITELSVDETSSES